MAISRKSAEILDRASKEWFQKISQQRAALLEAIRENLEQCPEPVREAFARIEQHPPSEGK